MADNCNPVFNLATLEVAMVMSARFMKILKSVTDKSLNKINPTIQGKIIFDNNSMFKKTIKLVITKILSARGSIKTPNFDTT